MILWKKCLIFNLLTLIWGKVAYDEQPLQNKNKRTLKENTTDFRIKHSENHFLYKIDFFVLAIN